MRKAGFVGALLWTLSGCTSGQKQDWTLLPYGKDDEVLEIIGKTIVNVPVWTVEGALLVTVVGMYLAALAGYRRG